MMRFFANAFLYCFFCSQIHHMMLYGGQGGLTTCTVAKVRSHAVKYFKIYLYFLLSLKNEWLKPTVRGIFLHINHQKINFSVNSAPSNISE